MVRLKTMGLGALTLVLGMAGSSPALAKAVSGPSTLVVGVDHFDPANQQPDLHRVLEYTDFFARNVTVHQGEVVDFRTAPGTFHAVGLARDEKVARQVYPIAILDRDDPNAIGSGEPKIAPGPANGFIIGGSTHGGGQIGDGQTPPPCGLTGEPVCSYKGGDDIESQGGVGGLDNQGNPAFVDWSVRVDAAPGVYDYLCFLHPGMQGKLTVVSNTASATSQAENDLRSQIQYQVDQAEGLAAEAAANVPRFRGGLPGTRTYQVDVSVASGNLHATMLEMLPQHLDLKPGDRVEYYWEAPNEVHTVGFPDDGPLPASFGFDCGSSFQNPGAGPPCMENGEPPELVGDPGTSPSGSLLTSPTAVVDSGLLAGRAYELHPTTQRWSVSTNSSTANGEYTYQCTVHDFMVGNLRVTR